MAIKPILFNSDTDFGVKNSMDEKLIKSKERVRKFAEVFTPERIVELMCNNLPTEAWEIDVTLLEPSCGNGNFLIEIFVRKLKNCQNADEGIRALKSIYGIDIQLDNIFEARMRLLQMFIDRFGLIPQVNEAAKVIADNIICGDFLELADMIKEGTWEEVREKAKGKRGLYDSERL